MKAILLQYETDDDGEDILLPDDERSLTEVLEEALDDNDFYHGRDHDLVLQNIMRSYVLLIETLSRKGLLNVEDINNIVGTNIAGLKD